MPMFPLFVDCILCEEKNKKCKIKKVMFLFLNFKLCNISTLSINNDECYFFHYRVERTIIRLYNNKCKENIHYTYVFFWKKSYVLKQKKLCFERRFFEPK